MQSKDATVEEYKAFSKDQVRDFSEKQKAAISELMDQLIEIIDGIRDYLTKK